MRNDVEYLPIDAIAGRIATTPFVVYPPGIATIVPGERLTERAQPMIDYLKMFETCFNTFPGFEVEIQGVYREVDASGRVRLHTYVVSRIGDLARSPSAAHGERATRHHPAITRRRCRGDAGDLPPPHSARHRSTGSTTAARRKRDDLRDRRKNLRNRRFPHLAATRGGEVVGYAYVVLFRKRPAYRYMSSTRSMCTTIISAMASGGC